MSGLIKPSHFLQRRGYSFSTALIQSYIDAYYLHFMQWADREWPWAWISLSSETPTLIYKSSIFWVKLHNRISSSWSFLIKRWPSVGIKSPLKNYLASFKKGIGFFLKNSMSNTASGLGKLYYCSLLYRPVLGDRKSGIPAPTLRPAPVKRTTFLYFFSFIPSMISS